MTTGRWFHIAVIILFPLALAAQNLSVSGAPAGAGASPALTAAMQEKVASGRLLVQISEKQAHARAASSADSYSSITTTIYASEAPSAAFIAELATRGVRAFADSWIPPSAHHPLGFFLAQVPIAKLTDVLALGSVKKMDTAESESVPMNNLAAHSIGADVAWSEGYTGTDVTVGVLDAGLDVAYAGTELPSTIVARDYSAYPALDDNVISPVSAHGTHVTGSILGRGALSASNTANGGGAYKGMAPNAKLVFLKIGNDFDAAASDGAEIAAIHAAVDEYHVNLLNLSYGGWDTYHDGSNAVSQAIDYAYSKGVSCFVAAGNQAALARHAQGFAPPAGISDFIEVRVTNPGPFTQMKFNLVWFDGADRNNLTLQYYDANKNLLSDVTRWGTTQSARGTESQYSKYDFYIPNANGTFYLRVVNPSAVTQEFHVYEYWNTGCVTFAAPNPNYTITYPGDADHAFTVGAYSTRNAWTGVNGSANMSGTPVLSIASYSGRGPRVNGGEMKPNIAAPGTMVISLRDHNVLKNATNYCVSNSGTTGDSASYYIMEGTSMAAPICTGAAALLYQRSPGATPQQIYDELMEGALIDPSIGVLPGPVWGMGKLDIKISLQNAPLPVELTTFTSTVRSGAITLVWHTASETNNYGFEIEKKEVPSASTAGTQSPNAAWSKIGFIDGSGTTTMPHEYSFTDKPSHDGTYAYRLKQIDRNGAFTYSQTVEVAAATAPANYALAQNYPNPFNPSTTIHYTVAAAVAVRLAVYDLLGREVAVLADRQMEPGTYSVEWNAGAFPSGVYFYRLEAGTYSAVKKLLLQK